mgnify:CR=1 FL=1
MDVMVHSKQSTDAKNPLKRGGSHYFSGPPSGSHPGGVLVTVGVWLAVQDGSASLGPSGSSLATWNKPSPEVQDKLKDAPLDWNLQ